MFVSWLNKILLISDPGFWIICHLQNLGNTQPSTAACTGAWVHSLKHCMILAWDSMHLCICVPKHIISRKTLFMTQFIFVLERLCSFPTGRTDWTFSVLLHSVSDWITLTAYDTLNIKWGNRLNIVTSVWSNFTCNMHC